MSENRPSERDLKGKEKRTWEIVALVAACVGVVVAGVYGTMQTIPAYRTAAKEADEALTKSVKVGEKRKKELGGKKGPDGPEVEAANSDYAQAREKKNSAMMHVFAAATGGLVLGFWGFLAGVVALLKAKYRGGKFFKTLTKRVFAIFSLIVGSVALYLSLALVWAMN